MNPTAHRLAVLAIYAAGTFVFFVAMGVVSALVDGPSRWVVDTVYANTGTPGLLIAMAATFSALCWGAARARRRDERRQIATTGVLHVDQPVDFGRSLKRVLLWTSPLWAAVAVLFCLSAYVVIRGPA